MKYSETTIAGDVEILASNDYQAIPAKIAVAGGASSTIVPAGTPIDSSGLAADSSTPVGILLYDVDTAVNPNAALLVDGIIDAAKAEAHIGNSFEYSDAVKAALPKITFRTNIGVNE